MRIFDYISQMKYERVQVQRSTALCRSIRIQTRKFAPYYFNLARHQAPAGVTAMIIGRKRPRSCSERLSMVSAAMVLTAASTVGHAFAFLDSALLPHAHGTAAQRRQHCHDGGFGAAARRSRVHRCVVRRGVLPLGDTVGFTPKSNRTRVTF